MKKWIFTALIMAASGLSLADGISLNNVWGRFSAPGMTMSGVFMDIANQSGKDDVLVGGSTPVAGKVELHTHVNDNGVMRMREVEGGIALAKGKTASLQPGGLHVMLIGLKQPLKIGDSFPLTLKFKQAKPQTITVNIKAGPNMAAGHEGANHGKMAH